ncbi:MAG: sigma-70 family RNA polymerase sigma factor [Planctomycetes bacterium]|nr:sigma-70 family RNA polymerase sigma factor [Planctomycetota bacterium]
MLASAEGGSSHESATNDPGVAWMLRYQRGDERAFDQLVEGYSPRVFALVTRFLGPSENREDLVQEVFLRVIRARHDYRPEARFSTWLYRIVFNLCVNENERRRPSSSLDEVGHDSRERWEDERGPAPGAALERADLIDSVRRAIAALPARQRMALVLAKYEELPYDEVARVLGTSEKAIKSMVHRARESLRTLLASFLEEELA